MSRSLELVPVSYADACGFVDRNHRHAAAPRGHKFSIGAAKADLGIVGVIMVGRPVARGNDDGWTLEVNRLCVLPDIRNAASFLLGAAARSAFAQGYRRLCSYTLQRESGVSMRAAGWREVAAVKGRSWNFECRPRVEKAVEDRMLWELVA